MTLPPHALEGPTFGPLVDIGVNLTDASFDADLDAVIERARSRGVVHQLVTGTDVEHAQRAAALAAHRPDVLSATAGVHPHHAGEVVDGWREALAELADRSEVRALGETGLDFARDFSPRDAQESVFLAQVELARRLELPLFLHERDTRGRLFDLLESLGGAFLGVLHCFTGSARDLERTLALGLHVGITGWICDERRGQDLAGLVTRIPADRLLLETDAPYLMPRTIRPRPRTRRNEPALLPWVLARVAECRGEPAELVAQRSTLNAQRLFGLPLAQEAAPESRPGEPS